MVILGVMDWFGLFFLGAFTVSIVRGKAYFRGFVERETDPRRYWSILGCYLALAALGMASPHLRKLRNSSESVNSGVKDATENSR